MRVPVNERISIDDTASLERGLPAVENDGSLARKISLLLARLSYPLFFLTSILKSAEKDQSGFLFPSPLFMRIVRRVFVFSAEMTCIGVVIIKEKERKPKNCQDDQILYTARTNLTARICLILSRSRLIKYCYYYRFESGNCIDI